MRTDHNIMSYRKLYGLPHRIHIPRVITAGNICGMDIWHDQVILAGGFAQVAVENWFGQVPHLSYELWVMAF